MLKTDNSQRFDFAALDRDGEYLLLGEIKTNRVNGEDAAEQLASYLRAIQPRVPYALLVGPDKIHLYRWDGEKLSPPVSTLSTAEILSYYDPEASQRHVFEDYVTTLIEAWLRDLAYHWKSARPPGSDDLERAGLLSQLQGGGTLSEVRLSGGHLLRD